MTATLRLEPTRVHTVYRNAAGQRVPSVTTVLGLLNKPALLTWAHEQGLAGLDFRAVRDAAADLGTVTHALVEAHLKATTLDAQNVAPDVLKAANGAAKQFIGWWAREQLAVVATELPLVSERWQVGGTCDVLARRASGQLVVVDLKTSSGIYHEMLLQVAAYAAMVEETKGEPVSECVIVRVSGDDVEVRTVGKRAELAGAFAALVIARERLKVAGVRV